MLVLLPEDEKPGFFFLGLFMDHLQIFVPISWQSWLLILEEWLTEQMSSGQYEEELTPCNYSLLRISGMLKIYFSCLKVPEQKPLLVPIEPAVQVHQHPPLHHQSVGTIANGETRLTSTDHLVESSSSPLLFLKNSWVLPSSLWIQENACLFSLTYPAHLRLQVLVSNENHRQFPYEHLWFLPFYANPGFRFPMLQPSPGRCCRFPPTWLLKPWIYTRHFI